MADRSLSSLALALAGALALSLAPSAGALLAQKGEKPGTTCACAKGGKGCTCKKGECRCANCGADKPEK